jgi:Flp pilus assembly protein TadG
MGRILMKNLKILDRLWSGAGGNAAMEFGLILPIFTTIVITIADVSSIAVGTGEMQTAVRAAVQYIMNGGTDTSTAQTVATNAWNNEPNGGTVNVSEACYCSGTSHACNTLCSDNSTPQTYYTVTATGTLGGSIISEPQTVSETVRIK